LDEETANDLLRRSDEFYEPANSFMRRKYVLEIARLVDLSDYQLSYNAAADLISKAHKEVQRLADSLITSSSSRLTPLV
jgi:hypothetical protein